MKKLDSFSSVGIFFANALTAVLVLVMWIVTHNVWLTVGSLILLPFAMMKLFNRNVNTSYKVLVAVLTVILFGMFAYFFRFKVEVPKTISDGPTVVITDEDNKKDDNDTPQVEEQEVIVSNTNGWNRKSSKPTAQERITPTYSNTGGSSERGGSVNTGVSKVTSDKPAEIVVEGDNQEQAQKIADEVAEGKDKIDLNKGVTAIVDNRESEEENKQEGNTTGQDNKNNEEKLDTTNRKVEKLDPQPEPEEIPAPLPKTEQLKKDMTEMSDDELLEVLKDVKPTVDTQPGTTQEENSSDKISEETTSSTDTTKNDDTKATTPEEDVSTNVSQEVSDNKQVTEPEKTNTTDNTNTVVTEPEEVVTPAQPEYTPVGITSLDGPTAIAGDTVQFKVTGDVKSVDGFDGLSYTNSNGYISVETKADESTVLTPVVTGQDGSTATTSVVVNVLNGQ